MNRKNAAERLRRAEEELQRAHREDDGSPSALERCDAAACEHFLAWALTPRTVIHWEDRYVMASGTGCNKEWIVLLEGESSGA